MMHVLKNQILQSYLAISAISLLCLMASACATASAELPTPSEPGRVNIREGHFSQNAPLGDANFSAVLPEGWRAADTPTRPFLGTTEPPMGVIVKQGSNASLRYTVLPEGEAEIRTIPGYSQEQITIEGVTVDLLVPGDLSNPGESYHLQAAFPSVPGDPDKRFSVQFSGNGLRGSETGEARSIIESVRYTAEPVPPPSPPEPQITPGPDWQRIAAHSRNDPGREIFSVLAPPGWEFVYHGGLDSFVGTFTNGAISIDFDYGSASGMPVSPEYHLRDPESFPELLFWAEAIDGKPFLMFKPVSDEPHERAYTGVSTARIPGLPDLVMPDGSYSSSLFDCGGSFLAHTADRDEQELVLAILRTLQAEEHPGQCR